MDALDLLRDAFGRVDDYFGMVADGLDADTLNHRPGGTGNSVAWLLWHLTRVQDDHVADLAAARGDGDPRQGQAWATWRDRFALPLEDWETGYGHSGEQVASVRIDDPDLLTGYHADVQRMSLDHLDSLDAEALDQVVDRRWDPPVTAGVRLVSVVGDCLAHLGQADYVKGLAPGR